MKKEHKTYQQKIIPINKNKDINRPIQKNEKKNQVKITLN